MRPLRHAIARTGNALLAALVATAAFGALPGARVPAEQAPAATTEPEDPLGRSTPYGTVIGFVKAGEIADVVRAANYLESDRPADANVPLARSLTVVLNRGLDVQLDALSRSPEGSVDDGLAPDLEKVGTATFDGGSLDIMLRHVAKNGGPPLWLFSSETLAGVSNAASRFDLLLGERVWPASFRRLRILGFPVYLLINGVVAVSLALAFSWLITLGLLMVLRPLFRLGFEELGQSEAVSLRQPLFALSFAVMLRGLGPSAVTVGLRLFATSLGTVLTIGAVTLLAIRLTALGAKLRIRRLRRSDLSGAIAGVELSSWAIMCVWIAVGLVLIVRSLGLNPTTAVAGLGVGGLALAFAAQKTIENLFGTITVISEKAIKVGDHCRAGSTEGWVESIGLRSTQIRTPDRALVSIPNGMLSTMSIANLQRRDKLQFDHVVRLGCETTAEQLRSVLAGVRALLAEDTRLEAPTNQVRFIRFGESSLDFHVSTYVRTDSQTVYEEVQEQLLLDILSVVESCGARIAVPTQTLHIRSEAAPDDRRPS